MGITSKLVTISSAALGLAVFSQAPEFAQQYRQRIGGAIDELRVVVTDFDRDAANSNLSRVEALDQLVKAPVKFSRDRGQSMTRTVSRFENLGQQQQWIEDAHPFSRPLFVLRNPDEHLVKSAWEIFEPGVPLTSSGFVWGGVGGLLFMIMARFGIGGARRITKRQPKPEQLDHIEPETIEIGHDEPKKLISSAGSPVSSENVPITKGKIHQAVARARGIPEQMRVNPGKQSGVTYAKLPVREVEPKIEAGGDKAISLAKRRTVRDGR